MLLAHYYFTTDFKICKLDTTNFFYFFQRSHVIMKKSADKTHPVNCANCSETFNETPWEYIMPGLWSASRKILLMRGIICLGIGTIFLFFPGAAIVIGIGIWGIYMISEALIFIIRSLQLSGKGRFWGYLNALFLLLIGLGAIIFPWLTGEYAVLLAGCWLLVGGFQQMWLLKAPGHRIKILFSSLCSIVCGIFLIITPLAGLLAGCWLLAIILWAAGCSMLTAAYSIKPAYQPEDI